MVGTSAIALIAAVRTNQLSLLRELVHGEGAATATSAAGRTALHAAAEEGNEAAALLLLDSGWAVDARMAVSGETPLHRVAAMRGNIDLADPDPDRAKLGLGSAMGLGSADLQENRGFLEWLLRTVKRSGISIPDGLGIEDRMPDELRWQTFSALMGLLGDREALLREMRADGIDPSSLPTGVSERLLGYPGHIAVARLLLEHGAEVNARDGSGDTPLMRAAESGEPPMAKLLLGHGALVNVTADGEGPGPQSPLECALKNSNPAMAELLLSHGAVLPAGSDALHSAAYDGNHQALRILLTLGLDIDAPLDWGRPPLLCAAAVGNANSMQRLIDAGANLGCRDREGAGVLHLAVEYGPCVKLALDQGLDANALDGTGATPLHCASREYALDSVQMLMAAGAVLDAQDVEGNTPLHALFFSDGGETINKFLVLHTLVQAGARLDLLNADGKTPYDLAVDSEHTEEYLLLLDPRRRLDEKPKFIVIDDAFDPGFLIYALVASDIDGLTWPSVAHYFHAQSFQDPAARERIRQGQSVQDLRSETLALWRQLTRKNRGRVWGAKQTDLMHKALLAKFSQHAQLRAKLLATGTGYLIEGAAKELWTEGAPHNTLGALLMQIRTELQATSRRSAPR